MIIVIIIAIIVIVVVIIIFFIIICIIIIITTTKWGLPPSASSLFLLHASHISYILTYLVSRVFSSSISLLCSVCYLQQHQVGDQHLGSDTGLKNSILLFKTIFIATIVSLGSHVDEDNWSRIINEYCITTPNKLWPKTNDFLTRLEICARARWSGRAGWNMSPGIIKTNFSNIRQKQILCCAFYFQLKIDKTTAFHAFTSCPIHLGNKYSEW